MKKSHALVAFVGLFVLLTAGTAQSLSGTNTVDSGDIIDGQVKFADIKPDAVTSSRIRSDAVGASEIRADQVGVSELADNSVGSLNIIDGTVTSADITNGQVNTTDLAAGAVRGSDLGTITQRSAVSADIVPGATGSAVATCLAGEVVLSGGNDGSLSSVVVAQRREGNGWRTFIRNNGGANTTVTAHAFCLAS